MLHPHQSSISLLNSWVPCQSIKTPRFPAWLVAKTKRLETTKGSLHALVRFADDAEVFCGLFHDTRRDVFFEDGFMTFEAVREQLDRNLRRDLRRRGVW